MRTREDTIQNLLRHAYVCSLDYDCNCSNRIREFLKEDKISLQWAKDKED